MKELTKAEEQIMQYLWKIKKGFVKDIVEQFSEESPAYTTITTVIRVLVSKGFIDFNTYGKVHEYFPKISKSEYLKMKMKSMLKGYFNESYQNFITFFTQDEDLTISELEDIKKIVEEQILRAEKDGKVN